MYIAEGEGCDLCRPAYIVTSFACPPHVVRGSMSVHISRITDMVTMYTGGERMLPY